MKFLEGWQGLGVEKLLGLIGLLALRDFALQSDLNLREILALRRDFALPQVEELS